MLHWNYQEKKEDFERKRSLESRAKTLLNIVNDIAENDLSILDIGIERGFLDAKLLKNAKVRKVTGLDIKRPEQKEWSKEYKNLGIDFVIADTTRGLPFSKNTFDVVLLLQVLAHLYTPHPPMTLFKDIHRVLKDNGYLIISTVNIASLRKRLKLLLGKSPTNQGFYTNISWEKHVREYTGDEMLYALKNSNFLVNGFIFSQYDFTGLNRTFLFRFLLKLFPKLRGTMWFVAKKVIK